MCIANSFWALQCIFHPLPGIKAQGASTNEKGVKTKPRELQEQEGMDPAGSFTLLPERSGGAGAHSNIPGLFAWGWLKLSTIRARRDSERSVLHQKTRGEVFKSILYKKLGCFHWHLSALIWNVNIGITITGYKKSLSEYILKYYPKKVLMNMHL